ncbi:MAG: peptide deformylase [Synechococcaceae cyanobacterium]|nr:peptide deformylase [Synechococcaceae cyanobacterium]
MAVRPVLQIGDPRLRQLARPVPEDRLGSDALDGLIADLLETMEARQGVGLAAPQIGEPWRVIVVGSGRPCARYPLAPVVPRQVLINPWLTRLDDSCARDEEGCLSVPGQRAQVLRWRRIRCRALAPDGSQVDKPMEGFEARVAQHELDHLNGVLFPDRLQPPGDGSLPDAGALNLDGPD